MPPHALRWLVLWSAGFVVRLAYVLLAVGPGAQPASDSILYDSVAWNLAQKAGFALNGAGGPYPTAFVPPLVPLWVSFVYRAVGHHYLAALVAQCAIGALIPLALVALGRTLYSETVGWNAGVIASVYPLLVFFNAYLLTETTFALLVVLALSACAVWVKRPRAWRALLSGALWGAATLARPTAGLLPLVLLPWMWRPLSLSVERRRAAGQVAGYLAAAFLCVLPWTVRNAIRLHAFVPVTTGGGRSLLDSNNPRVFAEPALHGNAISTAHEAPYEQALAGLPEAEQDRRCARMAWAFLREHWSDWPRLAGYKLARFWRITAERGTTGTWQAEGSPLIGVMKRLDPLALSFGALLPLMVWGAVCALRGPRRWFQSLPLWPIAYFSALAVVYWGSLRMRLPAEPMLVLLAALGFDDLRRRFQRRHLTVVPR